MKQKLSIVLAFVLMLSTLFSVNVFAASYPSITSSKYIEFKAQQNINVYKDTACKIRGTSSPSKKYNASISSGDTCYIYKIEKNYIQVNYPTSSGRRTGYIKRNSLFDKTTPAEYISSAKSKVSVYKSSNGSCITKGDKVWVVDSKKEYSGYKAVIYEAKSGKRAYKMGYIKSDDFKKIKNASTKEHQTTITSAQIKVEFINSQKSSYKAMLEDKQKNANDILTIVKEFNKRLAAEKALGVATIATLTQNPWKLYNLFDEDAAVGALVMSVSEATYQSAVSSHNKFISASKNITTEAQANKAFEYFVDSLSKYKAVIAANIDTINRYGLENGKTNYRQDMINSYLSSVASNAIPASEYKAVVKACEAANTAAEMLDIVSSKYAGYDAMTSTRKYLYERVWNNLNW